jgi:tetratricopeptide (TPR) repeat protein
METAKPQPDVTEEEIDAAEKLRKYGQFPTALALTQDMLCRVQDGDKRMRLLFDVLYCSTQLREEAITEDAIRELEKYPSPEFSRALANSIRAHAEISLGNPGHALTLLDMNLETGFFEREDFRVHKYDLYLYRGMALERLSRWDEALEWLKRAHEMYPTRECAPNQWVEIEILFNSARCMMGLKRFDEAYELSKLAYESGDEITKTVAMQYMADCRMWQGRLEESLKLYLEIQQRPPCVSVKAELIQDRINACMDYLEKRKSPSAPS